MEPISFIKKRIPFFSPRKILESGQIFRMYREDCRTAGLTNSDFSGDFTQETSPVFRIHSTDKILLICPSSGNTGSASDNLSAALGEEYLLSCTEGEWNCFWKNYFDCCTDYPALFASVPASDRFAKAAAADSYGIRVLNQDLFEMMISFIISQQKRIPEIRKCIEALSSRFGEKITFGGKTYHAFPTAESIAAAGPFGVCGLSLGYRERYVYETAVRYASDTFLNSPAFRSLSYEEAKKYLKGYCGIGEKVANCICLFALGFKDAFPIDVHIKDILHREYGVGGPDYRKLPDSVMSGAASDIFSYASGCKGILQQWIFAYELKQHDIVSQGK